ncbi:hypothetical protein TPA0909_39130 [Streptomyces albus]|nr:hypothetical protein TPA0909_39130 [Streptomyces albus]
MGRSPVRTGPEQGADVAPVCVGAGAGSGVVMGPPVDMDVYANAGALPVGLRRIDPYRAVTGLRQRF